MQWLRLNQWRIVICTQRDLRRAHDCTKVWLEENDIPFDYLFMVSNNLAFCKAWGIRRLVDDTQFNIVHGARYDVDVYYSIASGHPSLRGQDAHGYQTFEEVKRWIQE